MNWSYIIKMPDSFHIAIANLHPSIRAGNTWYMSRINVPVKFRGQGYGSHLLKVVLADANEENISIELLPSPSGGLDLEQLLAWYQRNGFEDDSEGFLVRRPQ